MRKEFLLGTFGEFARVLAFNNLENQGLVFIQVLFEKKRKRKRKSKKSVTEKEKECPMEFEPVEYDQW